jgi:arginine-tRNA-protein transferase
MSRTQRRVWRRNQDLRIEVGPVQVDAERVALFNRHRQERGLALRDAPMEEEGYARWFLETSVPTVEMRYRLGDRLVGVGIVDLGQHDSSSVYFYFDPDASARSPGTFGVLAEVAWLHARGGRHHYLGLHVGACGHLAYKASFHPHERLVGGRWIRFP